MIVIGFGCLSLFLSLAMSMFCYKRINVIRKTNAAVSPTFICDFSATPIWFALALTWLLMPSSVFANDRFYTIEKALSIGKCVFIGAVILAVLPSALSLRLSARKRIMLRTGFEFVLACVAVWQGVRFDLMSSWGGSGARFLGEQWGSVLSVAWIFCAMQAFKLLGGLGGAGLVLLLVTSELLMFGTLGTTENVLRAFTILISCATVGSLPFFFLRDGLVLRGSAMSMSAYLFALLTVLARQKAATTVLVFVPLAALVIAGAGIAIVLLERGIRAKDQKKG